MAGLPSGTVTFLFTDIEGSTTRWEHQAEAMRVALARHDALLRAAIVEHHGHVVKTMGDAFHAAFARAPDALTAALDAQRRLQSESWGEIGPLRVRMALHTGAAEERDGDYYGPALNRAARLLATGHGGQVLLSEATAGLVRDALPDGVRLLDLGRHRLKDLAEPERVSQVVAPDLPSDFPPLASLDARPHNLPTHPTALLGRERELAEVRRRFEDGARLVTLTGPGGTGKTRLGLQAAADFLDDFEHGVFLVDLAPISDPALVPSTVAQALGVRDVGSRPIVESLEEYLRARSLLLLLDNFEQILPAASVVADLLASCPGLAVLATSREPLRLRGEHEYAVPPLALPDARQGTAAEVVSDSPAVALFVQRARAIRADFALTDENASAVAEVCARLDGLPLAIELAAARVRLMTPEAIAGRLERRLPLLVGGTRDLPTRQQTLGNAIAWSYDLLSPAEQRLFRRLGVFVGGFTLEAVEAVCDVAGDLGIGVLDGVESLVAKSLQRYADGPNGEPRFTMLETIREFAFDQLEVNGEAAALRRRHADYVARRGEQAAPRLTRADAGLWLDRLETDLDNLRAALAWSAGLDAEDDLMARLAGPPWRFWLIKGHFIEGRRWLERALGRASEPAARIPVLQGIGTVAFFQDNLVLAHETFSEMEALGRGRGDPIAVAYALAYRGFVARQMGEYERAEELGAEAVAQSRRIGDGESLANALLLPSQVPLGQADYDRTAALLEEALTVARSEGVAFLVPHILQNLARATSGRGEFDRATALCEEAHELFRERGDRWGVENAGRVLLRIVQLQGDAIRGRSLARENLVLNRDLGSQGNVATDLEALAWIARVRGAPRATVRLLGAADALRDALRRPLQPEMRRDRDADLTLARAALGEEQFAAAWAEGRAMTLEQAIAYALDEQPPG